MDRRRLARSYGILLVLVGLAGVWHVTQSERVACLYREARYGNAAGDLERIRVLAERAYAISPVHYLFWTWVCERARDARPVAPGEEREEQTAVMACWCERGLAANPWSPALRVIHAGLLCERDPRAAIRWWESCVAWQYWEPYNHALLAELYARAGEFTRAFDILWRIRGQPYAREGVSIVQAMMAAESARQTSGRDAAPHGR